MPAKPRWLRRVLVLASLMLPITALAEDKPTPVAEQGALLDASNMPYERVLDSLASQQQKDFTVKVLRFALTGSVKDFEAIAPVIDKDYKSVLDTGQSTLHLAVTGGYNETRAEMYEKIYHMAWDQRQPAEALDAVVRAIFYDSNDWVYWAFASTVHDAHWAEKPTRNFVKAEMYGKIALCLQPRDPGPYYCVIRAYYAQGKQAEISPLASRALEVAKFDKAYAQFLRNDYGRGYFMEHKGRALVATGDKARGEDYLKMAVSVGFPLSSLKLHEMEEGTIYSTVTAKRLKLGDAPDFGLHYRVVKERLQVTYIRSGSPAAAAGLQVGDVIESFNGHPIRCDYWTEAKLEDVLNAVATGATAQALLHVRRGNTDLIVCK
ncbi:MAG TPA: PDZ domain-containing protein [Phycisphaerae bacterium]|nr:PDZ domain-containing protein [Phycisphaerae bacterium]HRY69818.1 PDZ domain-containing protein [Phycisphaerae bacterium]HSA25349.1 PDZ domain-containing protein [Phycisphaerae bacterium]